MEEWRGRGSEGSSGADAERGEQGGRSRPRGPGISHLQLAPVRGCWPASSPAIMLTARAREHSPHPARLTSPRPRCRRHHRISMLRDCAPYFHQGETLPSCGGASSRLLVRAFACFPSGRRPRLASAPGSECATHVLIRGKRTALIEKRFCGRRHIFYVGLWRRPDGGDTAAMCHDHANNLMIGRSKVANWRDENRFWAADVFK